MRAAYFVYAMVAGLATASSGDNNGIFKSCVKRCEVAQCSEAFTLPLALRLTLWTCTDDCQYQCMHAYTTKDADTGVRMRQYFGKWPFWRLGGIQEPASVAFSAMNFYAHLRGLALLRQEVPRDHPMKIYLLAWSIASVNTWIWSMVFHTRDMALTEKLDYFSAALTILCGLYVAVIRLFHLYPSVGARLSAAHIRTSTPRDRLRMVWSSICLVVFLGHISYLTFMPSFDYAYNIVFNAVVGLSHNILWSLYALPIALLRRYPSQRKSYRPPFAKKAGIAVLCMTAAVGLELFDFPPWGRVIDAHSLWHLATALIAPFWYNFLVEDMRDPSWNDHRV